jgi:4-hydroxy-3-methylbut-2-enyl diphosphate reductase
MVVGEVPVNNQQLTMINVEIDDHSGFCFGVTTAIRKAEEELQRGAPLHCLGDIVHNGMECERLHAMGLIAINHEEFAQLHNVRVLLRAHGEPPETYEMARRNNIEIIDATCPVVLNIQKRIKQEYTTASSTEKQIINFISDKTPVRYLIHALTMPLITCRSRCIYSISRMQIHSPSSI